MPADADNPDSASEVENILGPSPSFNRSKTNTNPGCEDCGFYSVNRGERRDHRAIECQKEATVHYSNGVTVLFRQPDKHFRCMMCPFTSRDARKINMHSKKCESELNNPPSASTGKVATQVSAGSNPLTIRIKKEADSAPLPTKAPKEPKAPKAPKPSKPPVRTSERKKPLPATISQGISQGTGLSDSSRPPTPAAPVDKVHSAPPKQSTSTSNLSTSLESRLSNPWLSVPMPKSKLYPELYSTLEEFQKRASSLNTSIWPYPIRTMGQSAAVVLLDYRKHIGYGPPPADLHKDIGDLFVDYTTPENPLVYFVDKDREWRGWNEESVLSGDTKAWIEVLRHPLFDRTYLWAWEEKGVYWIGEARVNEHQYSDANPLRVNDKTRAPFICNVNKMLAMGAPRDCYRLVKNEAAEAHKMKEVERRQGIKMDPPQTLRNYKEPLPKSAMTPVPRKPKRSYPPDFTPGPDKHEIRALFTSSSHIFDRETLILNKDGVKVRSGRSTPVRLEHTLKRKHSSMSGPDSANNSDAESEEAESSSSHLAKRPRPGFSPMAAPLSKISDSNVHVPSPLRPVARSVSFSEAAEVAEGHDVVKSAAPSESAAPVVERGSLRISELFDLGDKFKGELNAIVNELNDKLDFDITSVQKIQDFLTELAEGQSSLKRKEDEYSETQAELRRIREDLKQEREARVQADARLRVAERERAQIRVMHARELEAAQLKNEELSRQLRESYTAIGLPHKF